MKNKRHQAWGVDSSFRFKFLAWISWKVYWTKRRILCNHDFEVKLYNGVSEKSQLSTCKKCGKRKWKTL